MMMMITQGNESYLTLNWYSRRNKIPDNHSIQDLRTESLGLAKTLVGQKYWSHSMLLGATRVTPLI